MMKVKIKTSTILDEILPAKYYLWLRIFIFTHDEGQNQDIHPLQRNFHSNAIICVNLTYSENSHAKKSYPWRFKDLRKQGGDISAVLHPYRGELQKQKRSYNRYVFPKRKRVCGLRLKGLHMMEAKVKTSALLHEIRTAALLFALILHIMKIHMRRNQGLTVTQANLVRNGLTVLGFQSE